MKTLEVHSVAYMMIGGYALPFYGRIRATVDVDLAVAVMSEEDMKQLGGWLKETGFEVTIGSFQDPLIVVLDSKERVEIELWLRPDGVVFDNEVLRRRRKVKLDVSVEVWVVSPEDFIVSKLARADRGAVDEQDVKSVLIRQEAKLDNGYLERRAREAGVLAILQALQTQ